MGKPTAMAAAAAVVLLGAATVVATGDGDAVEAEPPGTGSDAPAAARPGGGATADDGATGPLPADGGNAGRTGQDAGAGQASATEDTLTPARRAIRAHRRADRGPEQPIPFSHRFHVSELQIGCQYCHTGTEESQVATMPALSVCMGCHRTVGRDLAPIDSLRSAWEREEPVAWQQVYEVPAFVQFKHQAHLRNQIECQECHGPVEEMDRVYKANSLTMGWCLSCHRQQPKDSDVATDAMLIRQAHVPEAPPGDQPVGLYPRTISTGYASSRAPDGCATCHY